MQDFRTYDYSIKLENLLQVLQDAIKKGFTPQIVINGEYYDIKTDNTTK